MSTLSCLCRLAGRHSIGILLPLSVTELTRKRTLPKDLALLGLGKQSTVFNFSPGGLWTDGVCPGFRKEQEKKKKKKRAGDKGFQAVMSSV